MSGYDCIADAMEYASGMLEISIEGGCRCAAPDESGFQTSEQEQSQADAFGLAQETAIAFAVQRMIAGAG